MPIHPVNDTPTRVDNSASTLIQVQNTGAATVTVYPDGVQVAPGGTVTVPGWSATPVTVQTAPGRSSTVDVTLTAGTPAARPGPGPLTVDPGGRSMTVTVAGATLYTDKGLTTAATFPATISAVTSYWPANRASVTVTATVAGRTFGPAGVTLDGPAGARVEPADLGTQDAADAAVAAGAGTYAAKTGDTYTGTHDFTGATVTGIAGGGGGAAALAEKGTWATATAYAVFDVASQGGLRYACRTAHTSGAFATDLAASRWVLLGTPAPAVFTPEMYGAKGDWRQVADAAMTSGSAVLTSATAAFTAADVGKWVSVQGAGAAGIDLVTTISAFTSATQVTLAAAASTTVSAKYLDIGTDDTSALQQAINAACAVNGTVQLAAKTYVVQTAPSLSGGMNAILKFPTASPFSVTVEGVSPAEQAESMFITGTAFPVSLSAIRTFRVSDTFTSDPPAAVMAANRVAANITLKNFAIVAPRNPRICGVDFAPGGGGGASRCEFDGFAVVTDWRGTQPVNGDTCDAYWAFGVRTPGHSNYDKVLIKSALVCGFWTGWLGSPEHFTALDLVTHRNRIGIAWYGPQNAHAAVLHKLSAEYCSALFAQWDPAGAYAGSPGTAPFQAATYPFVVDLADLENTEVIIDPYNKLRGVLNYFQFKAGGVDRGSLNVTGGKGLKITNLMRLGDGTIVPDNTGSIIVKDGWLNGANKPTLAAGTSGFGNCLTFDGSGSTASTVCAVNLGLPAAQNTEGWAPSGTTPFTVELIFKRARSGVAETLIGAWSTAAGGGRYELQLTAGNVLQGVMRGAGTTNHIATGSSTITDTAWHSAALSYDGTNMRIFLDGTLQATAAAASNASPNSTLEMYVGARPSGEQPFQGSLDEVRISRVARYTSAYTAASAPFASDGNTIALYHFDEIY